MAADVHAVVADLGLRRPALVGISMGGTVALQSALDYPADIIRLVVLDSVLGIPPEFGDLRDADRLNRNPHAAGDRRGAHGSGLHPGC